MSSYKGLIDLVAEIKKCEKAEATLAGLVLSFVCIDTMAYLSMPISKNRQDRYDFFTWVDRYLKADALKPYQYRGVDVYAARCGLLHAFSAEAEMHRKDPSVYLFGYHDGGQHSVHEDGARKVAVIGTASFFNDVAIAVHDFISEMAADSSLRTAVESRLAMVYQTMPVHLQS